MKKFKNWETEQVETFVQMWNENYYVKDIAEALGKTHESVKMFAQRNKESLGLKPKINFKAPAKSFRPEWDREWYGAVPFGHWTITKPWRL